MRKDISAALEKENLDKDKAAAQDKGLLHSATLKESLGRLEDRVKVLKDERNKGKESAGWKRVEGEREGLVACFL